MQDEELYITNCQSPPQSKLHLHTLQLLTKNHLITGDFNGHSPAWGYDKPDSGGEEIQDWMMDNNLVLINMTHDKPSHFSWAWKTASTPDLAIATEDIQKRVVKVVNNCLLYTSPSPRDLSTSRMPSSA